MQNLDGLDSVVRSNVQSTDWASVFKELLHADPEKYVIAMLVILVMFFGWIVAKFIDAKFISTQVTKVVTAAGGIQNSNDSNIESNEKLSKSLDARLTAHVSAVSKECLGLRDEMARLRRELNDKIESEMNGVKVVIAKIADANKTVGDAVSRYQSQADELKTNFDLIIASLRKKQGGA